MTPPAPCKFSGNSYDLVAPPFPKYDMLKAKVDRSAGKIYFVQKTSKIMAFRQIPTMTKYHHGGNMSIMKLVEFCPTIDNYYNGQFISTPI